jgi:hypothetical protein
MDRTMVDSQKIYEVRGGEEKKLQFSYGAV